MFRKPIGGLLCALVVSTPLFAQMETAETNNYLTFQALEGETVSLDLHEQRWGDVLPELATQTGLAFRLHESAIENSLDQETLVSGVFTDRRLATVLTVLLEPYQCSWTIVDGEIQIVSTDYALEYPSVMMFDCADLLSRIPPITESARPCAGMGSWEGAGMGGVFRVEAQGLSSGVPREGGGSPAPDSAGSRLKAYNEGKIHAALDKPVRMDFVEMPFDDALEKLQFDFEIPIILHESAIQNGLNLQTPVTVSLNGISLQSGLRILLERYHCTWVVDDEVLKIVGLDYATAHPGPPRTPALYRTVSGKEQLKCMLGKIVQPDSWESQGGPGYMIFVDDQLVVSQTMTNQRKILRLLAQLSETGLGDSDSAGRAGAAPVQGLSDPFGMRN